MNQNSSQLIVGFVSPGWPKENYANGIVTYVKNIKLGLEQCGNRAFVLTHETGGKIEDDDVIDLRSASKKKSLLERALCREGRMFGISSVQLRYASQRILEKVKWLHKTSGLQLIEMEESFGLARFVVPHCPVPVVVRLHGPWFMNGDILGEPHNRVFTKRVKYELKAIKIATGISAPSRDILDRTYAYYRAINLSLSEVISHPIEPVPEKERWSSLNSEPEHILYVGRFDRHKGADIAIRAFAQLACRRPQCKMTFVGPDRTLIDDAGQKWSYEQFVNEYVREPSARARLTWLGQRGGVELDALRHRAAVTIVCSRYENFPYTVLEAVAMGCPLIATKVGGIPEILKDNVTGLLVKPGDIDKLVEKLDLLLSNCEFAVTLGRQAAIDCAERFNPKIIAEKTALFYHRVIENYYKKK